MRAVGLFLAAARPRFEPAALSTRHAVDQAPPAPERGGVGAREKRVSPPFSLHRRLSLTPRFNPPSQMLFQADHVPFSVFPVTTWDEVRSVCETQLADDGVSLLGLGGRGMEKQKKQHPSSTFPFSPLFPTKHRPSKTCG